MFSVWAGTPRKKERQRIIAYFFFTLVENQLPLLLQKKRGSEPVFLYLGRRDQRSTQ